MILEPSKQTRSENIFEIAEILALGLMRLLARKSSGLSTGGGESSLPISVDQSGCASPEFLKETAS
jgi:hypothetical protein